MYELLVKLQNAYSLCWMKCWDWWDLSFGCVRQSSGNSLCNRMYGFAFISFSFQWSLSWGERFAGCRSTEKQGSSLSAVSLVWPFHSSVQQNFILKLHASAGNMYLYSDLSCAEVFILSLAVNCFNYLLQQRSISGLWIILFGIIMFG